MADTEVYDSESKGVRAQGKIHGNKFVVLSGSYAVGDAQVQYSLGEKPGRIQLRKRLIETKHLLLDGADYLFTRDVVFNSPSEAASIIWGSNLNGRKVFGLDTDSPSSHILHFHIDSVRAVEGYKRDQILSATSRDRELVERRKALDKYICQSCGFKLSVAGRFVIECHHLEPLALGQRETKLEDLVSLCPTCHRIVHMREPVYSVADIKYILNR